MALAEYAQNEVEADLAEKDERKANVVRQENSRLRSQLKAADLQIADLSELVTFSKLADEADVAPPKWLSPARPKDSQATLMLLLSDLHLDEVVRKEEMDGMNAYDRTIATIRMERWVNNVVKLARHYLAGVTYDGVVLMLGGDMFSGNIHEELQESNADLLFGSLLYWMEQLSAAINLLADEFGKIHVVECPGNHGRMTKKPRFKGRARDNLDWLMAKLLERQYRNDKRITWQIPDSFDAYFTVYGRGQLLTHGDQATGGNGIGGIWVPVMRMRAKKQGIHMDIGRPFDTMWLGHFHQYISGPGLIINGSMKGYDEYAKGNNFGFEVPRQAMAIMTPEHGISFQTPVLCADPKREKW